MPLRECWDLLRGSLLKELEAEGVRDILSNRGTGSSAHRVEQYCDREASSFWEVTTEPVNMLNVLTGENYAASHEALRNQGGSQRSPPVRHTSHL